MKIRLSASCCFLGLLILLQCVFNSLGAQNIAFNDKTSRHDYNGTKEQQNGDSNLSLRDALLEIKRIYNVDILFEESIVSGITVNSEVVRSSFKNIEDALANVLKDINLRFKKIKKNTYIIINAKKIVSNNAKKSEDPADNEWLKIEQAQTGKTEKSKNVVTPDERVPAVTVTGTVLDETNKPLSGVSVTIKGTQKGVTTNEEGKFSIATENEKDVLVFSYVGFESREITIGSKTTLGIVLRSNSTILGDVVVIGYGEQRRKGLTNAVSSISSRQIRDLPISNPAQAMAGQLAGVYVQQSNGAPGSAPVIRVRGTGSISASNNPLYVIDGYPFNDANYFNTLNPADIESIDVLKDAAAASIYGSRGANGVVVVTTKRGKSGKTLFNFNAFTGISEMAKKMRVMNSREFVDLATEAFTAGGVAIPAVFSQPQNWANTDWQDVIFQNAKLNNYQVSASGGTDKVQYSVSGAHYNEEGIIIGNSFKRYNLNAKLDAKLSPKLKLNLDLTPSYTITDVRANSGQFSNQSAISGINALALAPNQVIAGGVSGLTLAPAIPNAITMPALIPVRYANGDYGQPNIDPYLKGTFVLQGSFNPLANLENYYDRTEATRLFGRTGLAYEIISGLSFNSALGGSVTNSLRNAYRNSIIPNNNYQNANVTTPNIASIAGYQGSDKSINWVWTNTLTYRKIIKEHSFTVLGGVESQKNNVESNQVISKPGSYSNDLIPYISGASDFTVTSFKTLWSLISYFGRLNYNFSDRYLLSASIRRDGSSRFGPNTRYANFPSVSVAWRITNEKFMANVSVVSELKLRASYGVTGNFEIGDFPWVATVRVDNYTLGGLKATGLTPNGFANPDLTWETNKQKDFGLDMGLWKDRVYLKIDYYQRNTDGLISSQPIPTINGFSGFYITNVGNIQNKGWEFALTTQNITGALRWTTNFNVSFNRNKVTSLVNNGQTIISSPVFGWSNTHRIAVGRPLGDMYGYIVDGIFQTQQEADAGPKWNGITGKPGDPKYRDLNKDGIITDNDITVVGNAQPDFTYGITNTLSFKGFDLNIITQGVQGGEITNGILRFENTFTGRVNATERMLHRWRSASSPGDGITPRATINTTEGGINQFSSRFIFDASFFRIRNITLGYTVPSSLTKKVRLQNARIYLSAQNLHTFSKYFGYDPEVNQLANNENALGLDQGTYPTPRTFSAGINIGF